MNVKYISIIYNIQHIYIYTCIAIHDTYMYTYITIHDTYMCTNMCMYIYMCVCFVFSIDKYIHDIKWVYMIPVPGPVAPPMVWSPTPWPRIFHFHGIYSILDAKPHISIVFAPVWMENLIFLPILPILPTGPIHLPHPQGGGRNHDQGGETIYTQLPFTGERGWTMTVGGRGGSSNLEHIYTYTLYYVYIYIYIYMI